MTEPASFTNLAIIDWEQFASRYGKPAIQKMVLQSLLTHHAASPQEVRTLTSQNDAQAVEKVAHKLKGAAGIISAPRLTEIAKSLEGQVQNSQTFDPALAQALADGMDELLNAAQAKLATLG